jgi:hypothetical protein
MGMSSLSSTVEAGRWSSSPDAAYEYSEGTVSGVRGSLITTSDRAELARFRMVTSCSAATGDGLAAAREVREGDVAIACLHKICYSFDGGEVCGEQRLRIGDVVLSERRSNNLTGKASSIAAASARHQSYIDALQLVPPFAISHFRAKFLLIAIDFSVSVPLKDCSRAIAFRTSDTRTYLSLDDTSTAVEHCLLAMRRHEKARDNTLP